MTHHEIQTLPDGRRKYSNGATYKPLAPEERTYGVRKPVDPRAVRFHTRWYLPLDLLDEAERVMPATREEPATH